MEEKHDWKSKYDTNVPLKVSHCTCPQCKKLFVLLLDETVHTRSCPSGGVYDAYISCPFCDYEESI